MDLKTAAEQCGVDELAGIVDSFLGYEVLNFDHGSVTMRLPSEYVVCVKRVGPYAFDPIYDREDLQDPGPMKITIKLMEKLRPPGVEQEIVYGPPDEMPDKEEHPQAWIYYQQWLEHRVKRHDVAVRLTRARMEMVLVLAVNVQEGPIMVDSDEWLKPLLGLVDEPQTYGKRLLLFLKTQVVRTPLTADIIREIAIIKEVTIQGIKQALDKIRGQMEGDSSI